MLRYQYLNTNVRPLPFKVTSKEFTQEWRACWEDKERDIGQLLEMAEPVITHWTNLLSNPNYPKDINYISLCGLLDATFGDFKSPQVIKFYCEQLELISSVKEELQLIFIRHLRKANYFPAKASWRKAEYVISLDYKSRIKNAITKQINHSIDIRTLEYSFEPDSYVDEHADYLLIKNLDLTPWEKYLFSLAQYDATTLSMARMHHIPRETFYYEEKELWRKLKQALVGKRT